MIHINHHKENFKQTAEKEIFYLCLKDLTPVDYVFRRSFVIKLIFSFSFYNYTLQVNVFLYQFSSA